MYIPGFLPRAGLPIARQTSPLAPVRESSSPSHLWSQVRDANDRAHQLTNMMGQVIRQASRHPRVASATSGFHPFKIYTWSEFWPNSETAFESMKTNPTLSPKWWRTFRIRNGMVFTSTAEGYEVDGTDQIEQPYDEIFLFRNDGTRITNVQEYVVPDNLSRFYFWVEIYTDDAGDDQAIVRYGNDPSVSDYPDSSSDKDSEGNPSWNSTNPWTDWPTPDGNHIIIGWVDTQSRRNELFALPRQVQTTDILSSGGSAGTPCPMGMWWIIGLSSLALGLIGSIT